MQEFKIKREDVEKVKELYEMIPAITAKMIKFSDYQKDAQPIKKEMRLLYSQSSFPPNERKENHKQIMKTLKLLREDYNGSVNEWNAQMNEILKNYKYTTLKNFLIENPLDSIGIDTTKPFSFNIKKMADLSGIPILKSLYSGKPEMLNNYPKEWLLLVYKQIDNFTDHEI